MVLAVAVQQIRHSLSCQQEKSGKVAVIVLNVLPECIETVSLSCQCRSNGRCVFRRTSFWQQFLIILRNHLGRTGRVVRRDGLDTKTPQIVITLCQCLWMRYSVLDIRLVHSLFRQKAVMDMEFVFGHNVQSIPQHEIVILMNRPAQGILNGQAGIIAPLILDGPETIFKAREAGRFDPVAQQFASGLFGIGTRFALVGYAQDNRVGGVVVVEEHGAAAVNTKE